MISTHLIRKLQPHSRSNSKFVPQFMVMSSTVTGCHQEQHWDGAYLHLSFDLGSYSAPEPQAATFSVFVLFAAINTSTIE